MLSNDNYYSKAMQARYMSVSQFKAFEKCPFAALAEISGEYEREQSKALLIGSYVDAHFEGTLGAFKAAHGEIFKRGGSLKAEYIKADEMIARAERDPLFMEYMSGDKQVIMTGVIGGVDVKIKVDALHADKIVDLKTVRSFEPVYTAGRGRESFITAWGYDIQGAVYREIVRQNTGRTLPFYLACITKEDVPDIDIIELSSAVLDRALDRFESAVQYYDGIKRGLFKAERCGVCEHCRASKVLTRPTLFDIETEELK